MDRNGYQFYTGPRDPYTNGLYDKREVDGRPDGMTDKSRNNNQRSDDSRSVVSLDSTGKRKSFTRLITRFAEKTSMQGVPYINNAKLPIAKILWSILLIIALGMMIVHLWYLCSQFFLYPKITKVSLGFDNLQFPTVTICNTNPMHRGRFDHFDGAEELKEFVDILKPENLVPDQFRADYDPTATGGSTGGNTAGGGGNIGGGVDNTGGGANTGGGVNTGGGGGNTGGGTNQRKRRKRFIEETDGMNLTKYDPNFVSKDDDRDFQDNEYQGKEDSTTLIEDTFTALFMDLPKHQRARLGHNITDMLLGCTFGGRTCEPRKHQSGTYGNCWSIESEQFRVTVSGPTGGLSLTLYLEVTEYLEGLTNGYGMRLLVHEPSTFPFPEEEGHHISASFETNVGLRLITINREKSPYGECDPDIDSQYGQNFNLTYTRRLCQSVCLVDNMVAVCDCFDELTEELATRTNKTLKPCRSKTERQCKHKVNLEVSRRGLNCHCPVPCSEVAYEKSFSSRQWPSDNYAMVLLEGVCENDPVVCKQIRNNMDDKRATNYNFLKLNVYYEDLNFETIQEEPEIETAQFLSDVGGAIGLWIGLSILSMCEVFQLVVELCDYAAHKATNRGKRDKKRDRPRKDGKYSDSDVRSRDHNGREKDIERQWPHTNFGDVRDSPRPSRMDGRFGDMRGEYSEPHYPNSRIPR